MKRRIEILVIICFVLSFVACDKNDTEDSFDNRILGHWEKVGSEKETRAIRYEFDNRNSGKIVYYSPSGQQGDFAPGVPYNDTIHLKQILFTKGGEFRLISEEGNKYNYHIKSLTNDTLVFFRQSVDEYFYRVK